MTFSPENNFDKPKPVDLKEQRFAFSPKTEVAINSLRATLEEREKSDPNIVGFVVYGSRAFDIETDNSDLDIIVYYNEDNAGQLEDFNNYKMTTRDAFDKSVDKSIEASVTLSGYRKEIFDLHINEVLIYAEHDVITSKDDVRGMIANGIPSFVRTLVQPFSGGYGAGLKNYRNQIMDEFESKGEIGQRAFTIIMFLIEAIENKTKQKKGNTDFYKHYPKTISEARAFDFGF